MSKKIYFLLIVVILLLIVVGVAGFLFWQKLKPTPIEDFDTAKISPRRNFEIREEAGRKVIENKKDGLRFSVPQDWVLKEDVLRGASDFMIYSPDAEVGEREFLLKKGCKVSTGVRYIKIDVDNLEKLMKERKKSNLIINEEYEKLTIDGYKALKYKFDIQRFNISSVAVHIPIFNRIYDIGLDMVISDKERCLKEFDEILKTVSIKKKLF
jgi:hypothetical protein